MLALALSFLVSALPPSDAELVGEMEASSLAGTYAQLDKAMGEGKKDVTLRISSPGGEGSME